MQLIVLGMHRSGTSAVTRLINMMGAYFGPEGSLFRPDPNNPTGYWERKDFLMLNAQILQQRGCTWFDVSKWERATTTQLPAKLRQLMGVMIHEIDAHRPWVLKEPRFCITLPEWAPLLEIPLAVIVARDPLEIARSLERRHSVSPEYGLAIWEYHAVGIIRNAAALPRVFVGHDAVISDPVEATGRLFDALRAAGVRRIELPSDREILAFIRPALHRSKAAAVGLRLTPHQEELAAMLRGESGFASDATVSEASRRLIETMPADVRNRLADLTQYAREA